MESKNRIPFSVGGSSILMIFVVLCLTTFGILSYVTANADCKISIKNADTVKNYYEAGASVQTRLEQIDGALLLAKSDAKQAVDSQSLAGLKNKSLYPESAKLEPIFRSAMPVSEKYEACYGIFSRILVSRCPGVTVEETEEEGGKLICSFTGEVDKNRRIEVRLAINPYSSAERYRITGQKLVSPDSSTESEGNLQLWQGNAAD
jgi:hypothetical protein